MKFIFLDTETTGLEKDKVIPKNTSNGIREQLVKGDEVIQIGGLITDNNLNPIRLFCHHCDTTVCSMSKQAMNVHGISMEFLREHVKDVYLEEVIENEIKELYEDDILFIGYNPDFDITMIKQTLRDSVKVPNFGTFITNNIVPSNGKYVLDLVPFFTKSFNGKVIRQKLENLANKRQDAYNQFLSDYNSLPLYTNIALEKAFPNGLSSHNSMYDSIMCYILTRELWKQKLH